MPRPAVKMLPWLLPVLVVVGAAAMLYALPSHHYVVTCERATRSVCILEQTSGKETARTELPIDAGTSANVRIKPMRRGSDRVFLYLESPAGSAFAAEFEGNDADTDAARAAAELNQVLRGTTSATARIEAAPPPYMRRMAWGAIVVTALLIIAGYRKSTSVNGES